ncbi:MAG TPA: carbohydrate ABC transporter permease, partial [Sinomonas sp.]|nr:carbohydrate ABC transporter permease [Sinomonas sp.]
MTTMTPPRRRLDWGRMGAWAALAVAIAVSLGPMLWMLRTALSSDHALASHSADLLPADFSWGAFARVFGLESPAQAIAEGGSGAAISFWQFLVNSLIVSTVITVSQVFFSSLAAYAFARLRWPGRDKVFSLFLGTLLVPSIFTALPNFLLVKNLGLLNTYLGIALPT